MYFDHKNRCIDSIVSRNTITPQQTDLAPKTHTKTRITNLNSNRKTKRHCNILRKFGPGQEKLLSDANNEPNGYRRGKSVRVRNCQNPADNFVVKQFVAVYGRLVINPMKTHI